MPAYKNETTGKWYCKFYYTDWTGEKKQKKKSGFALKREALEWERTFLEKYATDSTIRFSALVELYMEDATVRLKANSIINKKSAINKWIAPYFSDLPINEITPLQIRKWHTELMRHDLKPATLRFIHSQLSGILSFAEKYYNLPDNPAKKAGYIGKTQSKNKMDFWTVDEYKQFISCVSDKKDHIIFNLLYYGGFRIGEVLALTPANIDFQNNTVNITHSYTRIDGKDIIDTPKTDNGVRPVLLPERIMEELQEYVQSIYKPSQNERIFPHRHSYVRYRMLRSIKESGVKQIRMHDLRHSHVSLCIELGFSPYLIAERIGDTAEMVLKVYGHLYPNKHETLAKQLNEIVPF